MSARARRLAIRSKATAVRNRLKAVSGTLNTVQLLAEAFGDECDSLELAVEATKAKALS